MYRVIYLLAIAAMVFGTSIYIGPATPRQYMAVILVLSILCNKKYLYGINRKFLMSYLIFLIFYGISTVIESRFSDYIREIVSLYMVAIVCYLSTILYYNKYKSIQAPLYTLYGLGLVNTFANLLQYLNHPIGILLGAIFVNEQNDQKAAMFSHLSDGDMGSMLFGLLGDPVLDGYFSMLIPILALYYVNHSKGFIKLLHWGTFVITFAVLFLIQQRAAFLITFVFSLYIFIKQYGFKKQYILIAFPIAVLACVLLPLFLKSDIFTESRLASDEDDSRLALYTQAFIYILENPLTGGLMGYVNFAHNQPHNVIFNAYIYGGIIGGSVLIKMLFYQAKFCLRCLKNKSHFYLTLLFAAYTLNGFLHNPSLVTGDALLWILWGLLYASTNKSSNYQNLTYRNDGK